MEENLPKQMHANEVAIDAALVRRLLKAQFPRWADLPLKPALSAGTDNAVYRLSDDLSVRLPRIGWATGQIDKESAWLPRLAPHLPLEVPVPLAVGEPDQGYPHKWAVYKWLEGENAMLEHLQDPCQAAADMAQFVKALQQIDSAGGPLAAEHGLRGVSLKTRDKAVREAIKTLEGEIDRKVALALWEEALEAPEWAGELVWFHGDLLVGNVLFKGDRLSAVIDFGGLGVGDPAPDLMIAWSLFSGKSREAFREALGSDEATWRRGRGQALAQAVIFIPYYLDTNPVGVAHARRMLEALLQ